MPERLLTIEFWQRTWIRYRWFCAWSVSIAGVIFLYFALQNNADAIRSQSLLGAQTHTAVCALRHDLKDRVETAEEFIKSHPHGFAGVTVKVLSAQIVSQKKTITSLSTLTCP